MTEQRREILLSIRGLQVSFDDGETEAEIIRGIDLDLDKGRTLAIVGESGSGKSVLAKTIMGILPDTARAGKGSVKLSCGSGGVPAWKELLGMAPRERQLINGKRIAMVFQDPMTSLNPLLTIGTQLTEGMRFHLGLSAGEARRRAGELLRMVGLSDDRNYMRCYPHQLSGGMRQRVVIAIALSCSPDVLICDEPTTSLDVTVQDRILDLIRQIQTRREVSIIFITHDMGVVARVADDVAVMYAGKFVEMGTAEDIFYDPRHPYTWGLLSAIPDGGENQLFAIPGSPPDMSRRIVGDAFARRSPCALKIDFRREPPLTRISETHYAATWLLNQRAPEVQMPQRLKDRIDAAKRETE